MTDDRPDIGQIAGARPGRATRRRVAIFLAMATLAVAAILRWQMQRAPPPGTAHLTAPVTRRADPDDLILIPIRAFNRRIAGNQEAGVIMVSLAEGTDPTRAKADIERLMRERRRIAANEEDDFTVFDMEQITAMLTGITSVLTGLLSGVAAISLLVGGIGIMNIMTASVTERTREIAIRLAIGGPTGQVLLQFLVAAIVLSLIGGLIGIALGPGLGYAGARTLSVPFWPDPGVIAIAFAFSAFVGIVFGCFPARRAERLDLIEALRYQ